MKQAAVEAYGAEIHFCEPTLAAREETAERVGAETGARLIHPYDDDARDRRAGDGGGGAHRSRRRASTSSSRRSAAAGLISGTALAAARARGPKIRVIGAEPAGADDAARSFAAGESSSR